MSTAPGSSAGDGQSRAFDFNRITKVFRKPPHLVWQRAMIELGAHADRFRAPRRAQRFDAPALADATGVAGIGELWRRLSSRVYAIPVRRVTAAEYQAVCPGDLERIVESARQAMARRVDVLGTGTIELGSPIDWHRDFKTGKSWPTAFMRDINYTNLGSPSDVKVPWEISRLQWLIPVGQLYLVSGDERCARAVRSVIEEWIDANPYAHGVNWTCTMEVAMRIMTWTWFFHVFSASRAWADEAFQGKFLRTLFLHGDFTERYIERSDINGNHFTADAAGLLCAGLFFGSGERAARWAEQGWRELCEELPRQVTDDGVDFEASIAYHRLVFELFFLAARYREAHGLPVPAEYQQRVIAMARFAQAYTRPDGSTPLVGDADDARALPFGSQAIGDHRYIAGLVGAHWDVCDLKRSFSGPLSEVFWTLGRRGASSLTVHEAPATVGSAAFPAGGFYVMRNDVDHVFIDCGPVGQGGRGGHGHNDCLAFEAALAGVHLVSDCGAFVYTASVAERNKFRSSSYHNTPQVNGEELNRFVRWDYLWSLHDDAVPDVRQWETGADRDVFVGAHSGYQRLDQPVVPVRTIVLDHARHSLRIEDRLTGTGEHSIAIPLHLAPGVAVRQLSSRVVVLSAGGRSFRVEWESDAEWTLEVGEGRVSPRYGVALPTRRLVWRRNGPLAGLVVTVSPTDVAQPAGSESGVDRPAA